MTPHPGRSHTTPGQYPAKGAPITPQILCRNVDLCCEEAKDTLIQRAREAHNRDPSNPGWTNPHILWDLTYLRWDLPHSGQSCIDIAAV